jgi:putative dehydrogenase
MLDCPVSGTGAQAAKRDIVLYASGEEGVTERWRTVLGSFSRAVTHVGPFGAGMKLKCVANLLVTIHNLASAEAMLLAEAAGLDPAIVYDAIRAGAGNSRIFELRAPMMIEDRYAPPTMKMAVHMKDIALILDAARDLSCPTPLLAASVPYYEAALAEGRQDEDTAALFAVLRGMKKARS